MSASKATIDRTSSASIDPDVRQTAAAELATGWPVLLAAALGIGVGIIALPSPAIGVFMRDLQAEFGWTRAEISLGPTILIATLAAVSPFVGWLADRIPPRAIIAGSLASLALSFVFFSSLGRELWVYYVAFAVMAAAGSGATTIVYARLLSATFQRARGLALGLAMVGNGVTGIVLPLLLVPYAATHGWRQGFLALAVMVMLALPAVVGLLSIQKLPASDAATLKIQTSLGEALGSRVFWMMAACFVIIPFSVAGLHLHFLAYLADIGVDPVSAGGIASAGGVALVVARVLTGFLIDRIFAPYVAAAMMGLSALAVVAMAMLGSAAAVFGAVAVGLSIGAELDLIGYLAARYFGLKAYGRIYGLLYALVLVGSAGSPLAYGFAADLTGSYTFNLFASGALLLLCSFLFLLLPRFPTHSDPSPA